MAADGEQFSGRGVRVAAFVIAVLSGIAFLLALMQSQSGRWFFKTLSLENEFVRAKPAGDYGLRVAIPKKYRDDPRVIEQAIVLEDGRPLPLRIEKVRHVNELGRGRYRVTNRYLYISAPDNSSPKENGRRYELRAPQRVKPLALWAPLALFAGALAILLRTGLPSMPHPPFRFRPWMETALVLAISSATMLWSLDRFSDYSDGWLVIKGAPYSDALAWIELSESLAEGRGITGPFRAHRCGYALLLGGIFALLGGASLALAKLFTAGMLALAATSAYLLARSAFGRPIALLLLTYLLTGDRFDYLVELTLSEPIGFALSVIGLHQLYRACLFPRIPRFGVAGIFLGLSNIVRPFTLLALPLYGAVVLVVAWRRRWGVRRFAVAGAAYVFGAMIVIGPWMARQKMTWGVATLDLNSIIMLYGAADKPEPGSDRKRILSDKHYQEGWAAGFKWEQHGERYRFYAERYRAAVAEDPADYTGFIAGNFREFFNAPGFGDGHVRQELGAVFFFALIGLAWRWRFAPIVLLAGLWPYFAPGLGDLPACIVLVIGVVFGFLGHRWPGRIAISLLTLTLCGGGLLSALVANFALNRGTVFIEWISFLLAAAGIAGAVRLVERLRNPAAREPAGEVVLDRIRFSDAYPVALLAVFTAGLVAIWAKTTFAEKPDPATWDAPASAKATARGAVVEQFPQLAGVPESDYFISRVRLGDYRWMIPAGRDLGHWSRAFEVRPFDRTLIMPHIGYQEETLLALMTTLNIPGEARDLDGEQDFLLVGLRNVNENAPLKHAKLIVETLAIIPYAAETQTLDDADALYFDPPPDLPPPSSPSPPPDPPPARDSSR